MALAFLAGRNSPAFAQELAALRFLPPEVCSELLRSALLGRAGGTGCRGAPGAAPVTQPRLQPRTSDLARVFLLSQLLQAGSAVTLVLFLSRFCLLRSGAGSELAAPGGVAALAITTLVPKITPAVLVAPHPRDSQPRHRL